MLETGEQGKTNLKEKFDSANTPPPPPPGKEPDSLNKCIWFHLKNSAQCRATQQVFYKLFTFKIIPNLQLKLCTLYVVHFLPVVDFRAALNPSIVSADVVLVGSRFQSLMVLGKNDCP